MTRAEIYKAVRDWIALVSGISENYVFAAPSNGPRPPQGVPYITYAFLSASSSDFSWQTQEPIYDTESGKIIRSEITLHTPRRIVLSVNVYALTGMDILDRLYDSRWDYTHRGALSTAGLVLRGRSAIRDLSAIGPTQHDPRFQADLNFALIGQYIYTDYVVDAIEINGHIETQDEQITAERPPEGD